MADGGDILVEAVRFVLNGWTVLQLAVQHGFGGLESAEKANWMIDVIVQVLRENGERIGLFSFWNWTSDCIQMLRINS